jgi:hypothetical protein
MLHPAYALKKQGKYTEYNINTERKAIEGFIEGLPEGKDTYIQTLNQMYLNLYSNFIDNTNYKYFLDKTPRYYLIIKELMQIYPGAKYIFLIRNPLAVLGSLINTWVRQNWYMLSEYKNDLTKAINELLYFVSKENNEQYFTLHYEDVLSNKKKVLEAVFDYLCIDYEAGVEEYYKGDDKWRLGDQESVYDKKGIEVKNDEKWQQDLKKPQYWRLMYDYLHYIGKDKFENLGYSFEIYNKLLICNMPADSLEDILYFTSPLFSFLDSTRECLIENQKHKRTNIALRDELRLKEKKLGVLEERLNSTTDELNKASAKLSEIRDDRIEISIRLNKLLSLRNSKLGELLASPYFLNKVMSIKNLKHNTYENATHNKLSKCVSESDSMKPELSQNIDERLCGSSLSFSVITVVYNDAELLERTIKSVINQSCNSFEYIVIDGGSIDGTLNVIEKYKDHITQWVTEEDKGIYDAMNKGIDIAKGDWLNFMNAGDVFVDSNTLVNVFNHVGDDKDVIYGDRFYVKRGNKTLQKAKSIETIFQRMPFGHQSTFVRRGIMRKYKFNDTYKFAADYNLLLNLFLSGYKFEYIGFPVCEYLSGGESESGMRPYLEVIKILLDNTKDPLVIKNNAYIQAFRKQASNLIDDCMEGK